MGSLAQPISAQNCQLSNLNEGLISALSTTGSSIGNSSQTCVLNTSQAIYRDFNVPSYQDLENQFYTLSRSSAKKTTPLSSNAGWAFTGQSAGNGIYLQTTSVTLPSVSGTGNQIVFIRGDLNIVGDISYADTDPNSGLVFITSGDINISSEVIKVNAVLISYGKICTAYNTLAGTCFSGTTPTSQLTINGSLISLNKTPLTSGQSALLMKRNLTLNSDPAEIINKQAKYLYNLRGGLLTKDLILIQEDKNYPIPTDTPVVIPPPPPLPPGPLTQGLVAHWQMNEASWNGTDGEIKDSSSTGVNGRRYNQANTVAPGKFDGKAGIFDGSDDYLTFPDNPALEFGSTDFSISTWVFLNSYPIGQLGQSIYAKDSGTAVFSPLDLVIRTGSNNINAWMTTASGSWNVMNDINLGGASQLTLNAWHHIVFLRSAGVCRLYIDGTVTTATQNGLSCSGTLLDNAQTHYIGGHFQGAASGSTDSINGKMDDFRIYKKALSTAEISALYTNTALVAIPKSIPNLALWLDADDPLTITQASGGVVSQWDDLSGNNRHFTQSTPSRRPAYTQNIQNGKPVIQFSYNNTQSLGNTFNLSTPNTVFYVSRIRPGGVGGRLLTSIADNWLLGYWGGSRRQAYFNGWISPAGGIPIDSSWSLYSSTQTGSLSTIWQNGAQLYSNALGVAGPNGLRIGCSGEVSECSDGDVAEVIAYNRVLSTTERQYVESYLASKWGLPLADASQNSLISFWKMDETSGTTAVDSKSGRNGTFAGTTTTAGKINNSRQFATATDSISTSPVNLGLTRMTVAAWIQPTGSGPSWNNIVSQYENLSGQNAWNFSYSTGYNLHFNAAGTGCTNGSGVTAGSPSITPVANKWYFVAVTKNETGVVKFYVDGVKIYETNNSITTVCQASIPIRFGKFPWDSNQRMVGKLDEVGIWNDVLTDAQIATLYNSGAGTVLP